MDDKEKQLNNTEKTEQPSAESAQQTLAERRNEKIRQIGKELAQINYQGKDRAEIAGIQSQREAEYQEKLAELEDGLGQKLSDESSELIYKNLVDSVIEHAHKENERFDALTMERKKLTLHNNLELGEDAKEVIAKATELVASKDGDGSKIKIFEEALDYYSQPQESSAETPIYHSTGSYGLAKILENGSLDSSKNSVSGEQAATGEESPTTSFVVGGYDQSETVSYFYARKNERQNRLILDKQDITGVDCATDIVKNVFSELPKLKEAEQTVVRAAIIKSKEGMTGQKGREEISDEDLMSEKMKELQDRKYYYDRDQIDQTLIKLNGELDESRREGDQWKIERKIEEISRQNKRIETYNGANELQNELTDPFPVILVYEGKNLSQHDLISPTFGLISERRTEKPIKNSELRQIQVPKNCMVKAEQWLKTKMENLPQDSDEREALSKVKIIPLEFFEAKSIIKELK